MLKCRRRWNAEHQSKAGGFLQGLCIGAGTSVRPPPQQEAPPRGSETSQVNVQLSNGCEHVDGGGNAPCVSQPVHHLPLRHVHIERGAAPPRFCREISQKFSSGLTHSLTQSVTLPISLPRLLVSNARSGIAYIQNP